MATIYFDTCSKNARAILEQELDIDDNLRRLTWCDCGDTPPQCRIVCCAIN